MMEKGPVTRRLENTVRRYRSFVCSASPFVSMVDQKGAAITADSSSSESSCLRRR